MVKHHKSWNSKNTPTDVTRDECSSDNEAYFTGRTTTPSSILSTDSDIRFTRKFSNHYKHGCCAAASFLVTLLIAAILFYIAYKYVKLENGKEKTFRAMLKIIQNEVFDTQLTNTKSDIFMTKAKKFNKAVREVIGKTRYEFSFISSDVLAFDGEETKDYFTAHMDITFNYRWQKISANELHEILKKATFTNYTISDVIVDEVNTTNSNNDMISNHNQLDKQIHFVSVNKLSVRECSPVQLPACLPFANYTSYPNFLNHQSIHDINSDLISFRELIDAECFEYTQQFLCYLLQPVCLQQPRNGLPTIQLPCRGFCTQFWEGCGNRLTARMKNLINCSIFPEYSDIGINCSPTTDCRHQQKERLCDGVVDCPDAADESSCSYCDDGHISCGPGVKSCVPQTKICDGVSDCPNGYDENHCMNLMDKNSSSFQRGNNGLLSFIKNGVKNNICMIDDEQSANISSWICRSLHYTKSWQIYGTDEQFDNITSKVQIVSSANVSFVQVDQCPNSNKVIYASCGEPECGRQLSRAQYDGRIELLGKTSMPGDWPWHAALFKESVHICDATLISPEWLVTSISCFQGQDKAEWIARLGVTRLSSSPPWQQRRHIIGMVKSPVEGSSLVMVKLNAPVTLSDYVWPICLPKLSSKDDNIEYCNTLAWKNSRETLSRVELMRAEMNECENISITTVNSLCAHSIYEQSEDCVEEELAGSSMYCLDTTSNTWVLLGVSNWRMACLPSIMRRPRLYDKVSSNVNWITNTLSQFPVSS